MKKTSTGTVTTSSSQNIHQEISRLAEAMVCGRLDERGNPDIFAGTDAELIALVNQMLDSLVTPLRLAAGAIDEIAHGRIPSFVIDDYQGEYDHIKINLNTLLATLYGMHNETQDLISNINAGKLRTRGNDWDYQGIWRELIGGVNGTLDAVLNPINEASAVLGRLANYDLSARMQGRYHGEHAVIKKAMNTTAESLHSAISQVSETVELVSSVGNQITQGSEIVTNGAVEQEHQLSEAATTIASLAENAQKSAESTSNARITAQRSAQSITTANTQMERMLEAMTEIRTSADNTANIIQEIDAIASETDKLSASASNKATVIRSSASGFGVVASEIRRLSEQCEEVGKKLQDFHRRVDFIAKSGNAEDLDKYDSEYQDLIHDLKNVSTNSSLLGVNAAISAAHVEGAGNDFEVLTEEIRMLAKRSADAASKTGTLIQTSVTMARKGMDISKEIDKHLAGAVEGAMTIDTLTDEISSATHQQAAGLEQISCSIAQINEVTSKNATSAHESSAAAKNLEQQVTKLTTMVSRFRLEGVDAPVCNSAAMAG
jgi:methyl-accepting chemotaxis protein